MREINTLIEAKQVSNKTIEFLIKVGILYRDECNELHVVEEDNEDYENNGK